MKKIILLSHCVLNSFCELPQASDDFRKALINLLMDKQISMVQLPCPELCFQALERSSILPGDAKAKEYREECKALLAPIVKNLEEYKKHSIEVAGIIGIDTSPSCSVIDGHSIMMELLLDAMKQRGISAGTLLDMPVKGQGGEFLEEVKKL